jgi:FixJ family two-component response regulator
MHERDDQLGSFESGGAFVEADNRGRIACLILDLRMSGVNVLRQMATAAVAIPHRRPDGARRRRDAVAPDGARRPA